MNDIEILNEMNYYKTLLQSKPSPSVAMDDFFFSGNPDLGRAIVLKYDSPRFPEFADEIRGIKRQLEGKSPLMSYVGSSDPDVLDSDENWRNQNAFDDAVRVHEYK